MVGVLLSEEEDDENVIPEIKRVKTNQQVNTGVWMNLASSRTKEWIVSR